MTSELRRRTKLKEQNVHSQMHTRRHKSSRKGFSIHTSLLCLILSGSILTLFGILYLDNIPWHIGTLAIDKLAVNFGYHKPVYAVVIDAGSTGSRVLAFTFHESYIGSHLVLDKELFKYNKEGLSSFAENPEDGAKSIESLLEEAKNEIPQKHWTNTSLLLKATAGLRLLPTDKAEKLLHSVRNLFKKVPFLTRKDSVEIMDGTDEGIYSWFTVNFLLGRINGNPANTVAALDLGGGSTQVTFAALAPSSLKHRDRIHLASSPTGNIPVYTHSFLGLGLKAARKAILTYGQDNTSNITSECVNHIINGHKFKYGSEVYYVSGPQWNYLTMVDESVGYLTSSEVPIVNMDKCLPIIKSFIQNNSKPPEELPNKIIFAFSYYFDKAAEAGLIDPYTGGRIELEDFKNAATEACRTPNTEQPFLCLDLSFIWILLQDGLGLQLKTPINLFKKINGHEISWALGAAYDLLKQRKF
ncbi:ectonucleoside triphosphate diphosphohydrolase 5 isoform X2 [Coccinella septempunctata]|uniref:ectonucleoside triphosphate diphosphohydrolase 5 isoform X2 n=1 Tax=Coccinella septempunctata TaxID=41139 RepID=UPI001D096697|nr:ectonucleoside triphosphate diphosphohydrolase 5 isoform X2 [Coccinella septempunctata]